MSVVKVKIEGMNCSGCVKGIENAFSKEPAIKQVKIDLDTKMGEFEGDLSADKIIAILEDQGFDAEAIL